MAQPGDDLTLSMRLYADATRFVVGLAPAEKAVGKFASGARSEFDRLKASMSGVKGTLAAFGISFGATAAVMQSARLDKMLDQISLSAGVGMEKTAGLRKEIFRLSQETGRPVQELTQGFANLISSGMDWSEALKVISATNKASAVTGTPADDLTPTLSTAADAYKINLAKGNEALTLLDKITVSARLGNTEMDNMAQIFSIVGQRASNVKMSDTQTLGFIAGLSRIERRPRALTTIADSTLEFFNNLQMMAQAQNATGVRFFDHGTQRNPLDVLKDLRVEYAKLRTDADKKIFMRMTFAGMDNNTQLVLGKLLSGKALDNINSFSDQIGGAAGTLDKNLHTAIDNSVDQVDRLKNKLQEAADNFAKPINSALSGMIKFGLDDKKNGGLGLSGGQVIAGGVGLTLSTWLAARFGGKALGALGRNLFGIGAGVAEGKALEAAAGITPVFVVNMPGGGIPGAPGGGLPGIPGGASPALAGRLLTGMAMLGGAPLGAIPSMGAGAMAVSGAALAAAGAAGYGAGTLATTAMEHTSFGSKIQDLIGEALVLTIKGAIGLDDVGRRHEADDVVERGRRGILHPAGEQKGMLHVVVDDNRTTVRRVQSPFENLDMDVSQGRNLGVFG